MISKNFEILKKMTEELNLRDQNLITSEKYYKELVSFIPEGICELDLNLNIDLINKNFCLILGYTEDEILNKNISNFLESEMLEIFQSLIKSNNLKNYYQIKFKTKDSGELWTLISINQFKNLKKQTSGYLLSITNIHEIKTQKLNTINKLEILENFLEHLPMAVFIFKTDGELLHYNKLSKEVFGIKNLKNFTIQKFSEFLNKKNKKIDQNLLLSLQGKKSHVDNLIVKIPNQKKLKNIEIWSNPIIRENDTIEYIVSVFRIKD